MRTRFSAVVADLHVFLHALLSIIQGLMACPMLKPTRAPFIGLKGSHAHIINRCNVHHMFISNVAFLDSIMARVSRLVHVFRCYSP